jgi:hypothetical protein
VKKYTREQAFAELEEAHQLAREQRDPAAMVEAIRGKAKLFGLEIDYIVHVKGVEQCIASPRSRWEGVN